MNIYQDCAEGKSIENPPSKFGSYARGEETRESDEDILVEFHKTPDLFKFFSSEKYLEKLL